MTIAAARIVQVANLHLMGSRRPHRAGRPRPGHRHLRVAAQPGGEHRLDRRLIGRLAHLLIGSMLEAGYRSPDAATVLRYADSLVADEAIVYRLSLRSRLASDALAYFGRFAPPPDWTFAGREVDAPPVSLDLLWRSPDGVLWADELKTGRSFADPRAAAIRAQVGRQLLAGHLRFGFEFGGVRLCLFAKRAPVLAVLHDGQPHFPSLRPDPEAA